MEAFSPDFDSCIELLIDKTEKAVTYMLSIRILQLQTSDTYGRYRRRCFNAALCEHVGSMLIQNTCVTQLSELGIDAANGGKFRERVAVVVAPREAHRQ